MEEARVTQAGWLGTWLSAQAWLNDQETGASSAQLVKPRVEAFPPGMLPCPLLTLGFSKCPQKQRAWSMMPTLTHPVSIPLISLHHSPRGGVLRQVQTICADEHLTVPMQTSHDSLPALGKYHTRSLWFRFPTGRCLRLPGPLGSCQPAPCLKPVSSPL